MSNTSPVLSKARRPVAGGLLAAAAALAFLTACGDGDDNDAPASGEMSPTSEMMAPSDTMAPDSMSPSDSMTPSDSMSPSDPMSPAPMSPEDGMEN
ncbi:hypothetical protein L5G32_09580 [Gordonia sp. HY002]|uniref:hypothetical protein n=1 Tax=Gordonia zhenghanii TaxID=2911516 RepID=UPI001EEFF0C4|nr:hypothetical protein [Gordonia zhenghanii]MCF8570517.1 hypothetical protein [Gordonia zhenghanii]MCF8602526.1 hypothetical protein [Gordonia zhenghanii]